MATKETACNWLLLFDIALSHGVSLRERRLRYCGFMTLLRSAGLLGPDTGVYQFLVEALWKLHGQPSLSTGSNVVERKDCTLHDLTVDFSGFLEIMNTVCVRCYQTRQCLQMINEECPLSEAILLSAEDKINLKESVTFTARHFFKPLINRCIVVKKMVVSLDPMKNNWTPYTNQLVTHVIASSADSIIIPLFNRYAKDGRIYRAAFEKMIADVFPDFTEFQKQSAASVFDYNGFFGINYLMERCTLDVNEARASALELDSFAEALLMLGIVAFSDEIKHAHHRPLTAKVWSVFEDYYSSFMGVNMVEDPVIHNQFASIIPAISLVFPKKVPLDKLSSFIIGGWNLTVYERFERLSNVSAQDKPPRILKCDLFLKNSCDEEKLCPSETRPLSCAGLASKFFEEELSRAGSDKDDLPIYGMGRCTVYVDEYAAAAFQRGPNRAEVMIPSSIWDISVHTTRVDFAECGKEGRLILCPIKKVVVSLRDIHGEKVYDSMDVVFVASSLKEKIPELHMCALKEIFESHSTEGVMCGEQFESACVDLSVAQLAAQFCGCILFLKSYLGQRRNDKSFFDEHVCGKELLLSFKEFIEATATLLLYQLDEGGCLPNVTCLLGVAVSHMFQKLPCLLKNEKLSGIVPITPRPPSRHFGPYNARIDVPYANALRRKDYSLRLCSGTEDVLNNVREHPNLLRILPKFPVDAKTINLVSQYDDSDGAGLQEKVKSASAVLRETFLKKEMVVCRQGMKTE